MLISNPLLWSKTARAVLIVVFLLSLQASAQQCPVSKSDQIGASVGTALTTDAMIDALRADSGLLSKAKDAVIRGVAERGRLLKESDLSNDVLFQLIKKDAAVRSMVNAAIEDECKFRNSHLAPIKPEEVPELLGSTGNGASAATASSTSPSPERAQESNQAKAASTTTAAESDAVKSLPKDSDEPSTTRPGSLPPQGQGAASSGPSAQSATIAGEPTFTLTTEKNFLKNVLLDQKDIWTSPKDIRRHDLKWLAPFAGITTGLIVTDRDTSPELSRGNHVSLSNKVANGGVFLGAGTAGAIYFMGKAKHDPHAVETGILAAESSVNSLLAVEGLKYATGRSRPNEADGTGHFFRSGASFPSNHSAVAWSIASVIAHEYPGWLTQALAYGGATAVSMARVTGKQHFLSDVLVGGTAGYLIGRQVYRAHHDDDLGGERWGKFTSTRDENLGPAPAGSIYVPLDSWIYPALDRLAAMGVIHTQFAGLRPWTRLAIEQMLSDGSESILDIAAFNDTSPNAEADATLKQLRTEFAFEDDISSGKLNQSLAVDSLYTRSAYISGRPLNDSYHFGQTIINDFGRPYQEGYNQVTGFTSHAENGRFSFFARGEYQHSPGAPAYPLSVRQVIATADVNPLQPATPFAQRDQFRLLDTYASVAVAGHELSVGKQSLWWGPGAGGAMLLSNNAEPFYMIRLNRVVPLEIPLFSKLFGPIRYDNFFGRLAGHSFPPRPFFYGQEISLKPTPNFEFGFSRTAVFAGEGVTPLTAHTFVNSLVSVTSGTGPGTNVRDNPGARHSSFDFSYRLPFLRNWVTLYSDSIVHDDISPVDAPRRAGWSPGIYISHFPKLAKLDLRLESAYTDPPITNSNGGQFIYWETIYHDAHTNKGTLLGGWVGREGKGIQAWSTYWLSPVSTVQLGYRNAKIANDFIPQGVTQNDFSLNARLRITKDVEVQSMLQYERWNAPVLDPNRTSNFVGSVQLTFWPQKLNFIGR